MLRIENIAFVLVVSMSSKLVIHVMEVNMGSKASPKSHKVNYNWPENSRVQSLSKIISKIQKCGNSVRQRDKLRLK